MIRKYRTSGGGGAASNSFSTWQADEGTAIVADSSTDTGTLTGGEGIKTSGDSASDTLTVSVDFPDFYGISKRFAIWDDFITGTGGSTGMSGTGTRNAASSTTTAANPGVVNMFTGTTTTGAAYVNSSSGSSNVHFADGVTYFETIVKVSALSDGTDTYTVLLGMADNVLGTPDGIVFRYTHGTNSGQWQGIAKQGATSSTVNSSVAASTSFVRLGFIYTSATGITEFFINGTSIGSTTSVVITDAVQLFWGITKSAGTTDRTLTLDAYKLVFEFTTPR